MLSLFQTKEIDVEETPIASVKGNEVTSEAKVVDKPVEKPDEVVSQIYKPIQHQKMKLGRIVQQQEWKGK